MKVRASVVCQKRRLFSNFRSIEQILHAVRNAGCVSQYWNSIHGLLPGEAVQDEEGMQTMRTLARNMVFLMKSIELGKKEFGLPETEERVATHFIR